MKPVKIGIVGTSWWVDTMYLPPLRDYAAADVVALCGRNVQRAEERAAEWGIKHVFGDYGEMLSSGMLDAVIVATPNSTHYPIAMKAMQHDLHVLCEKPLALNYGQAAEMARTARERGLITLVPFTYRYMPTARYAKRLIDEGFIGQPYHIHLRYYANFGRDGSRYRWRFDKRVAGSGVLGDIGSHFLYLADWFFGEIEAVCSNLGAMVERPATDPQGEPYQQLEDTAMVMLRFKNGAHGVMHASALAHENTAFGQQHEIDMHGANGTLRQLIDWNKRQTVRGGRVGEPTVDELPLPDDIWGDAPRDDVVATYKHVFRKQGYMVRQFVDAVAAGEPLKPDFDDGARIQAVLDAAQQSHESGCWVAVAAAESD